MTLFLKRFRPRCHSRWASAAALALLLPGGLSCHDPVTRPATPALSGPLAPRHADLPADSPASASAELVIAGETPLNGAQQFLGTFPSPTVVAVTVHQAITIGMDSPSPNGFLGLAGRLMNGICTGQGSAYLSSGFDGCGLTADPNQSSYSGFALVSGDVYYGYRYDNACPPPGACGRYSGSSGASLTRLDAHLAFAVDPDPVSPDAMPAGHVLTVRAPVTPERLGPYATPFEATWSVTTAAGVRSTPSCMYWSEDPRECSYAFTESGTLQLDAVVNGVHQTHAVAVTVVQPTLTLTLSASEAALGDTVVVTMQLRPEGEREEWIDFRVSAPRPPWVPGAFSRVPLATPSLPALPATRTGVLRRSAAAPPRRTGPSQSRADTARGPAQAPRDLGHLRRAPATARRASLADGLTECGSYPFATHCFIVLSDTGVNTVRVEARYNGLTVVDSATIHVRGGTHLRITRAAGPNGPDGSFTTLPGEQTVALAADVSPASLASAVHWEITPLPAGSFTPRAPDPPADGAVSRFIVPASQRADTLRWPRAHSLDHAEELERKVMRYAVVAMVTAGGVTTRSEPVIVRQDAADVLRQEYIDWRKAGTRSITRDVLTSSGDPRRNSGDYALWPASTRLAAGMAALQALAMATLQRELTVRGGYRNPVHHHFHGGGGSSPVRESSHLYGEATDFRIKDPPPGATANDYFFTIRDLAWSPRVSGCFEPEDIITAQGKRPLDHAHVDWRTTCPPRWGAPSP